MEIEMIPTGWKFVPDIPTAEMESAGAIAVDQRNPYVCDVASNVYAHMLAAAPPPPEMPPEPDEAMVERVARAMEPELWSVTDGFTAIAATHARLESMHKARAAIAAMKDPK